MVARLLWEQDAAGSSPVTSTNKKEPLGSFFIGRSDRTRTCSILLPNAGPSLVSTAFALFLMRSNYFLALS